MKARSESDRELAEFVSHESGIATSPWQIETWRRAGLLQRASRIFPGRGSRASYSAAAKAQAIQVAVLAKRYRRHGELARVLFARGLYVEEAALRNALTGVIDRTAEWIGPGLTEEDLDRMNHKAQKAAKWAVRTKAGRAIQRRLRKSVGPEGAAADVYYTIIHMLRTGEATSDEGVGELLRATGISGMFEDRINGVGPIAPDGAAEVRRFLEEATLDTFRRLVRDSSWEDLQAAKDLAALFLPFLHDFGFLATRWLGLPNGVGLALLAELEVDDLTIGTWAAFGLLILPYMKTMGAQELLAQVRSHADWFRQLVVVAQLVPPACVPALRAGQATALDGLPSDQQARIKEAIHAALAHAPGAGGALTAVEAPGSSSG
jgi:hypothetical protein